MVIALRWPLGSGSQKFKRKVAVNIGTRLSVLRTFNSEQLIDMGTE